MKNKTIVLLKASEGEYDSYYEYVTDIYLVPRKNFNVELEYNKYLFEKIKECVHVKIEWKKWDHGHEGIYYPEKINRFQQKAIQKVVKECDIKTFLEKEFKAKRFDNFTEYLR